MRAILRFLIRQHYIILFIIIEALCLALTIRNNDYHRAVSIHLFDEISGNVHNSYYSVLRYLSTVNENKKLASENAELRKQIFNLSHDTSIKKLSTDSGNYELVVANIVYGSIYRANNYLIINKGSMDGVKPDMGVISSSGVVGIVKTTSAHFATIIPIINTNAHISARIKSNQFFGTTTWNGVNPSYVNLSEIPYHVKLTTGDTVITSGFSTVFPKGIKIGTITHFDYNQGSDFYNIEVKLFQQFGQLDFVYIVKNKLQLEFQQIQKTINNAK